MSLKKFEDFEHNLEEEDKNAFANDHVNATKDLLDLGDKITSITPGSKPDEVVINFWPSLDKDSITIKVIGYHAE
jgi:hypothetical protein